MGMSDYIEDIATEDLKLFFQGFVQVYHEFQVFDELVTLALEQMGIFLKTVQ